MIKNKFYQIINQKNYDTTKLYLIEKVIDKYGIFVYEKKIAFIAASPDVESNCIETEYVSFNQHVYLNSIINNPSFKVGYYDILIFNGDVNSDCFDSFYRLCSTFPLSNDTMSFKDFFYDLIELLSMPAEKKYQNLVGLLGELFFIKELYENNNINLSNAWHVSGKETDKYDFILDNKNIEIKTTSADKTIFKIKHKQIFNEKNNFIGLVKITPDNSGISLNEMTNYFIKNEDFSRNLRFMFVLEGEINRTNKSQRNSCFSLENIVFFHNSNLKTIECIPSCISNIEYDYDFANLEGISISNFNFKHNIVE